MRIRKSLFAVSATVLAILAFAASAMAVTEDKLVDVNSPFGTIPAGRELHLVGWAKFANGSVGSMECHVTAVGVSTGTAGTTSHVKTFTVPDKKQCKGFGAFSFQGCNEVADNATLTNAAGEFIWDVTATENDFDVSNIGGAGSLFLDLTPKGTCILNGTAITLTFPSITLKPLNTTNPRVVTNTGNRLGNTAATGESIAGIEISGSGTANINGGITVTASGELELSVTDRCTWKFAKA